MSSHSAATKPVRRRSSGQQTRAEILAAAERHFAERGFEAARLEDIAADVGIRRAAIFYYFGDKNELYAAVLDEVFAGALAAVPSGGGVAERLEASLTGWIDYVARRPSVARLILREAASAQPDVVSPFVRAGSTPVAWLRAMIDEGVASGELKPLTDPHRFISLMGATTVFHFAAMPFLTHDVPFDPWSRSEIEKLKREILLVARSMLGNRIATADPLGLRAEMNFEITPEQQELIDTVRSVLARECPAALVRDIVENGSAPEQPWKSARELGWTSIDLPETLGGVALGFTTLGLVIEQHGCRIAPGPFLATVTQFLPLVCEAGAPDQLARFAAPAGAGELRGALAIDHGRAAEHAIGDGVRARRDGAAWILEGEREYVLDGDVADEIAVAARVDAGDGVGLFVVPKGAAKARRVVALDASRPLAHLRFDGVRVEQGRVLGTPGAGARALARALERATVAAALECVGACQSLLELTLEHAKNRRQFDQPIGAFQAIQHKCADMFVQVEKARATGYFAMMALAEDDPRRSLAASMAKAAASDCQRLVCKDGIQIHGGMGYTWESDVQLFVKRAKTVEALFGTGDQHRQRIADLLEV